MVWRFHDHWHMRKPDGIEAGMVRSLGWQRFHRQAILSAHATGSNYSADHLCRISGTLRKANGRATTGSGYVSEVDSQVTFFPCRRATKTFVVQKTDKWDGLYFKSTKGAKLSPKRVDPATPRRSDCLRASILLILQFAQFLGF